MIKYLSWLKDSDEVKALAEYKEQTEPYVENLEALVAEQKREVAIYRNSTILMSVVMIATIILTTRESK